MRRVTHFGVIASALLLTAGAAARAELSVFWESVLITATTDGVTPPPGIAGYQCWDLKINLTPGDDFTSLRIFWNPPTPIFHHPLGGGAPNFGPPYNHQWSWLFPASAFDSYLGGPASGMTVLGATDGTNDFPQPGIFDIDRIAVAAGDLAMYNQGGTFQLLRLTVAPGSPAPFDAIGRVFSVQVPEGVPLPVPEPANLMLAGVGAVVLTQLRRRQRT